MRFKKFSNKFKTVIMARNFPLDNFLKLQMLFFWRVGGKEEGGGKRREEER